MNSSDEIQGMLQAPSFCVIGASRDKEKYGHAIFRAIQAEGRKTYPVNPNADVIGKTKCYHTVDDLPEPVDVAVFVVPPDVVEQVVTDCHRVGINNIWMQPGAVSQEAVDYCRENHIAVVAGECIMTLLWGDVDDDM